MSVKGSNNIRGKRSLVVEGIVGVVLLAVMGLGLMRATVLSLKTREDQFRSATAMQIALNTIEKYSAINPRLLDATVNERAVVTFEEVDFDRVVEVRVNADHSRTIMVSVSAQPAKSVGVTELSLVVVPWD